MGGCNALSASELIEYFRLNPVILLADQYNVWLGSQNQVIEVLKQLSWPCNAESIAAYPIMPLQSDRPEWIVPVY